MSYEFECWKPIKGFDGLYDISNYGSVYSYPRPGTIGGILKQTDIHLHINQLEVSYLDSLLRLI